MMHNLHLRHRHEYTCGIFSVYNLPKNTTLNVWLGLTASQIHFAMICSWLSQRQCGSYSTFAHHLVNSVQGEPWVTLSLKFIVIMVVIIEIRKDWAMGGQETGGRATGGWATGGWATGGWATGGWATGGWATGGWATGGWATGGWAT